MRIHGRRALSFLLCTVMAVSSGCAVMRPIRPSNDPSRPTYSKIEKDDFVVLRLRDGRRVELVVARVEPDAIVASDGARYRDADIERAEVRIMTAGKATLLTVAVAAGALVVLMLVQIGEAYGSWFAPD